MQSNLVQFILFIINFVLVYSCAAVAQRQIHCHARSGAEFDPRQGRNLKVLLGSGTRREVETVPPTLFTAT